MHSMHSMYSMPLTTFLPTPLPAPQHTSVQHAATHCNTLQHAAAYCEALQHTAPYCSTLQHTAICGGWRCADVSAIPATQVSVTHFNTLKHTATTLQLTVTRCNTLLYTATLDASTADASAGTATLLRQVPYAYMGHTHTHTHTRIDWQNAREARLVCNTLQPTATYCNLLQHTANALQHTATRVRKVAYT